MCGQTDGDDEMFRNNSALLIERRANNNSWSTQDLSFIDNIDTIIVVSLISWVHETSEWSHVRDDGW